MSSISLKKYPQCARGHKYALDIVNGVIPACKYVIGSCQRYLRDIENSEAPFYMDWDAAEKYLRNVQKFDHVIGHWKTKNIVYEPWQCFIWMNIIGFKNKENKFRRFRIAHIEVARGNAKALHIDTPVPTPDGMKKWKDISIGSRLYDRNGEACVVTNKNPIHFPKSYEIEFSDGEKIICSDKHLWVTSTVGERSKESRHKKRPPKHKSAKKIYERVRTTEEIYLDTKKHGRSFHAIKVSSPIRGNNIELPVDPYVFGYWLGNGGSASGRISSHENDVEELRKLFKKRGHEFEHISIKNDSRGVAFTPAGLHTILKDQGILNNKHIPEEYFLSTIEDRLELVRGLLDSDGSINHLMRGQVTFTNKNENISRGLNRILNSLGYKSNISKFKVSKDNNYKSDSTFYRVSFYPRGDMKVFNLKRKLNKQVSSCGKHSYVRHRYIVSCKKLQKKCPMFCVEVDSPDKTFLIGNGHIPTHNSAMASQAALSFLSLDDPNGNQISTVATKKEQARIVLDSARAMARKNSSFLKHTGVRVLAHSIYHPKSNSIVRSLASEANGLDGLNDVLAICDELHAMKRDVFEVITSGMSKRADSLILCITTAGQDVHSVGYSQSYFAKKIALDEVQDETFFSIVYTLDEEDDWADQDVWIKANPNLGISVDIATLQSKVDKAIEVPSDIPNIKIKHMNLWISEASAFYDQKVWDKCADPTLKLEDFVGKKCRMGVDLASHIDIATEALVFREKDVYTIFDRSYLPEETLKAAKNNLYDDCVAKGHLISTKGAAINYDHIRKQMEEDAKKFRVEECLYDAWNATETAQKLSDKIEMVKISMNVANFSEPMKKLDALMREGKIRHNGSPLLRWCLGNVVAKEDHNGNVYPRKSHEKLKIDPIIAILMALAGWLQEPVDESVYESRGIRVL